MKAAVQNGADSVYLGAASFSARASAKNFDLDELKDAIQYAKLRNVDVHLTLNTMLLENEIDSALNLANKAYSYGIDAIIVQDFGLANILIKNFPDLPIHASTQMTVHNLEGVKFLEKLGFKRVVLSRELSLNEIEYICKHTDVEIEAFAHGALCISYSGRCYMSSLIGGRSGNRGKCAQSCRLPYKLYNFDKTLIDNGYLLSPKDLCSLDNLPKLVNSGVDSLKIEGRMKNPEYVATVTRIYRKYIDKILLNQDYITDENDIKELMQVFNRGGFSSGHLESSENRKLIYPIRPNNIGLYLGTVQKTQENKGYITLNPKEKIEIGDTISFENEEHRYTISELIQNGKNVKSAQGVKVQIGRMKGNIRIGDKIFKMSSKSLQKLAEASYQKENKKILLDAKIEIKANKPISLWVYPPSSEKNIYSGLEINLTSDIVPEASINHPITIDKIKEQLNKTGNTQFSFRNILVELDDNLYIPSISRLNDLRRNALSLLESNAISRFSKKELIYNINPINETVFNNDKKIAILFNKLNTNLNYSQISKIDYIYIPLQYYLNPEYSSIIKNFKNTYIYMPSIIRKKQVNSIKAKIENIISKFKISGFVISNLADLEILPKNHNLEIISNFTFNVANNQTISELEKLGFARITTSIELPLDSLKLLKSTKLESIIYGRLPSMTLNYCLLGKSNHCYKECTRLCEKNTYYLQDRMNFIFPIVPDNSNTITTIFNSKTLSILPSQTPSDTYRIDIFDENLEQINQIINCINSDKRIEGKDYTNANLNRTI